MRTIEQEFRFVGEMKARARQERNKASKARLKPFLKGEKVILNKHALKLLARFIAFKEHQALKRNKSLYDFTQGERASIKIGFSWLLQNLEPHRTPAQRYAALLAEEKKCHKISRTELQKWLEKNDVTSPKQHESFFGMAGMLINTIDGAEKPIIGKENLVYNAVQFPGKILFGNPATLTRLSGTATHELGHERYGFGETICYAIQNFYLMENGHLTEKQMEIELNEKRNFAQGYLDGIKIVKEALTYPDPKKAFWAFIKTIPRKPTQN